MAGKTMKLTLEQVGTVLFEATGGSGGKHLVEGSPDIGGEGKAVRPMELLLSSVASCSAMDVLVILRKQREPIENLRVEVEGTRVDAVPSPYSSIKMIFIARGAISERKLQRACSLAVEKYCSARASIPGVEVTWEARLEQ